MEKLIKKSQSTLVEGEGVILSKEVSVFLLDVSYSMIGDFNRQMNYGVTKIDALKESVISFIRQRIKSQSEEDLFGVILFGTMGSGVKVIHDPSSRAYDKLQATISFLRPEGNTPMASAVKRGLETLLGYPDGFLRLVIVSDGQPDNRNSVLMNVREAFELYGVVTDTIGVGVPGFGLNEDFLKLVAEIGGGEYLRADSPESLRKKFLEMEEERALLLGSGILMLPEKSNSNGI